MIEVLAKAAEIAGEAVKETAKTVSKFNPDKRVIPERTGGSDVKSITKYNPDRRIDAFEKTEMFGRERVDGFYSTIEERIKYGPANGNIGYFEGEVGNSKFVVENELVKEALAKDRETGIPFRNGEPDFSKVSEETVKIDNMSADRYGPGKNFEQADRKCAEKWSNEKKDGRTDWTARNVENYRTENHFSWHERCDTETMDLVPQSIHSKVNHSGGCYECKLRDGIKGGGFDE